MTPVVSVSPFVRSSGSSYSICRLWLQYWSFVAPASTICLSIDRLQLQYLSIACGSSGVAVAPVVVTPVSSPVACGSAIGCRLLLEGFGYKSSLMNWKPEILKMELQDKEQV